MLFRVFWNYWEILKMYFLREQLWSPKFTSKCWFKQKKWKIISYKNYKLFLKVYIKTDKKYQAWWYWNWKTGILQTKKAYFNKQYRY